MSHHRLVACAVRWLRFSQGCPVVICETGALHGEQPDAIGWDRWGRSTVVECKASLTDFYSDRSKSHHRAGRSMGHRRFYLTPHGLVRPDLCPEDHGLLWVAKTWSLIRVKVKAAVRAKRNEENEVRLLTAEFRRVLQGFRSPEDSCGVAPAQREFLLRAAQKDEITPRMWGTKEVP